MAQQVQLNTPANSNTAELTADIVAAYVANNSLQASDLPSLIASVHAALSGAASQPAAPAQVELKPAVSVRKSVTPDAIICLEDGKRFKSLKRHLRTHHNMSPEEYRAKWGLASDYPIVAPSYAAQRSALALKLGLGKKSAAKRGRKAK